MDIILHLLYTIQVLYQQNCWLLQFICRYLPLKQWAFDDSHSPRYQKYKVDELRFKPRKKKEKNTVADEELKALEALERKEGKSKLEDN